MKAMNLLERVVRFSLTIQYADQASDKGITSLLLIFCHRSHGHSKTI